MKSKDIFWWPMRKEPIPKITLKDGVYRKLREEAQRARQEKCERAVALFGELHNNVFRACRILGNDKCESYKLIFSREEGELEYYSNIELLLSSLVARQERVILAHAHIHTCLGVPSVPDCERSKSIHAVELTFGHKKNKLFATGYFNECVINVWYKNWCLTPNTCKNLKRILRRQKRHTEELRLANIGIFLD